MLPTRVSLADAYKVLLTRSLGLLLVRKLLVMVTAAPEKADAEAAQTVTGAGFGLLRYWCLFDALGVAASCS